MSSTAPRRGSIGSDSGSCPFRAGYRFSIARRERPLSIISTCRSPLWQRAARVRCATFRLHYRNLAN
jgi:hypothetical protein